MTTEKLNPKHGTLDLDWYVYVCDICGERSYRFFYTKAEALTWALNNGYVIEEERLACCACKIKEH